MPSLAFARPLWPATLCALRDLTRLALAALVLAVGLGGVAATGQPARPDVTALPARPVANLVTARPVDSVRTAEQSPTQPARALAPTPEPDRAERLAAVPPVVAVAARPDRVRPAAAEGGATRRGPPTG
ncbi:hypothetical protein [Micromonospora radicis]|uniref:Uncharacterized protein n=1 Tax=Micromonospora radicis TaxID=1894971 RepID=A0A418MSI1_9ACTN|nr:hypothetical protein [Micromonospora radicis]RIV37052.1 hypothetical protein D2L64_17535 [Micromonospora radicis]